MHSTLLVTQLTTPTFVKFSVPVHTHTRLILCSSLLANSDPFATDKALEQSERKEAWLTEATQSICKK